MVKLGIIESDSNYVATIVKLPQLKKVEGLDNLMIANVFGYNCLVKKDSNPNELYIFFPSETVLSQDFLEANSLYRDSSKNVWKDKKGFFDDSGRVKAVKLRGVVSSGFLCPISYLHQFAEGLKVGDTFHSINGHKVCWKFRRPIAPERLTKSQRQSKRIEKFDIVIPNQFRFHAPTPQFLRFISDFKEGDRIVITEKLHGTSAVFSNVITRKRLSLLDRIAKALGCNVEDKEYRQLYSSRNVIKNGFINDEHNKGGGYYGEDLWGIYAKQLESKIEKGITLYGEIVGYTPNGQYIQKGYHYGCKQGESKFYCYRITYTTPDGNVIEFTYSQIAQYCRIREIDIAPIAFGFDYDITWGNELIQYDNDWVQYKGKPIEFSKDMCKMNNLEVPREGVVIRRDGQETYSAYKLKSQLFLTHETKEIDNGTIDIEENN